MANYDAVAAIYVDVNPWVDDNLWVREVAQRDPAMVGVIGNLRIEDPSFADIFGRFVRITLFRGLRYGNL